MLSKQDRHGARTAADIERKYNFDKRYAEMIGVATDARDTAENTKKKLDETMTPDEIFNILTNNGAVQGLYRIENGDIYINAAYIYNVVELFAKNITMTGKFTNTAEVFFEPGLEEAKTIQDHLLNISTIDAADIPLYDADSSGEITILDYVMFKSAALGMSSLSEWAGAVKTTATVTIDLSDLTKAICISGTNMWGRSVELYFGFDGAKPGNIRGDVSVTGKLAVGAGMMFETNENNEATLDLGITGTPKKLSWKDNGDGTFSLIGS